MDPTRILEADHREIEHLFAEIEDASGEDRVPFVERLLTTLRAHMTLEEEVVYPAVVKVTGEEAAVENKNEHAVARANLDEAESFLPGEPGLGAAMAAAQAAVSHHVEEEESDVFPKVREDGREVLDQIFSSFVKRRLELGMTVDAEALAVALSTDELRDHARRAELEGGSDMEHAELAEVLAIKLGAGS
jgi:hemerythrin superfamily protein